MTSGLSDTSINSKRELMPDTKLSVKDTHAVGPYRYVNKSSGNNGEKLVHGNSDTKLSSQYASAGDSMLAYDSDDNLSFCDNNSVGSITGQTATWGASQLDLDSSDYKQNDMSINTFSAESANASSSVFPLHSNGDDIFACGKNKTTSYDTSDNIRDTGTGDDADSIQDDISYHRYHNSDTENDNDNDSIGVINTSSEILSRYLGDKETDEISDDSCVSHRPLPLSTSGAIIDQLKAGILITFLQRF